MFDLTDKTLLLDKDYTFERMHEQQNQRSKIQHYTVKLPCSCDMSVEIQRPEDQYIECTNCHRKWLMTFSGNRTKIWGSDE